MKRRDEVLVGMLVTVALIVLVGGSLWLARAGLGSSYPLHVRFPWGAGLKQGQPALLAGIQVGSVEELEFNQNGWLEVRLKIQRDYRIPAGSNATVATVSFFGDKAIAINPPPAPTGRFVAAGDTLPAGPAAPTMDQILMRVDSMSRDLAALTVTLRDEMVEGGGIADMRRTVASTNRLVQQISGIADEQSRQLALTLANVRRATGAVDSAQVDSMVRNFAATSANLTQLTRGLQETALRLNTTLAKLDDGNGSAGRLLNDPGLYEDVRSLVTRLDSLTADFKKNPRRYVNLSIF
jgi:phospholipid/cholesterol/gamma-HCH transport system substrate-binding protein